MVHDAGAGVWRESDGAVERVTAAAGKNHALMSQHERLLHADLPAAS